LWLGLEQLIVTMLEDLENNFESLERIILKLSNSYRNLSQRHEELLKKYSSLKAKYNEKSIKNIELEEEKNKLRLWSVVSGNPEYSRLMKNHINRLVKEIDTCIHQLQNTKL